MTPPARVPYRRIATEEAWLPPEIASMYFDMVNSHVVTDPGFNSVWGFYTGNLTEGIQLLQRRLQSSGEERIADMDRLGIDMQILSLTQPGVQMFEPGTATSMARSSNDLLAEAIAKYPARFDGLAAIAPQQPAEAAKELERAVRKLKLRGAIINSHTKGEYLDDPKFWDILEALQALDVPLYIHPTTPPPKMIEPFLERTLDAAIYGFACETGLHILRMIVGGVFDRFPKLQVVLGHLGEGLPFWLARLDFMHGVLLPRSKNLKPLKRSPSEVLRQNFHYTTSGMCWEPAVLFVHKLMGADRILYAMDYPYQVVAEEVPAMDNLSINDQEKRMLFQTNAERVFRLPSAAISP
ncbi:amidohydrolase [Bradyrhizobium macuxiense]|uniref:Amidohydrolase n=1 Tax=Bradyrhizobium macuxiense TaxID=1755647 RepID=A0A109JGE0_9BRAD|nr:amidohydrolase family protein [Bradyrhizobium macuxiense]KWV48510.1 amidohydrolase [Bradyrhizobium macuxiense]